MSVELLFTVADRFPGLPMDADFHLAEVLQRQIAARIAMALGIPQTGQGDLNEPTSP